MIAPARRDIERELLDAIEEKVLGAYKANEEEPENVVLVSEDLYQFACGFAMGAQMSLDFCREWIKQNGDLG